MLNNNYLMVSKWKTNWIEMPHFDFKIVQKNILNDYMQIDKYSRCLESGLVYISES